MRDFRHYCGGCKRIVPHAPGLDVDRYFTIGVAHVVVEPMCVGEPCRPQRTYTREQQLRNLELLLVDLDWSEEPES